MMKGWRVLFAGIVIVGETFLVAPPMATAQIHTIANTAYPSVIRVAIRAYNNPVGPILYVQTVGFQQYCADVLPNEWFPTWNPQALRAGAVAIKMFAWYHALHPVTVGGFTFDVDNTTNFQQFKYLSGRSNTDQAVKDTWKMVFVPPNGEIKELPYRAGFPNRANSAFLQSGIMSQWGSEYWAQTANLTFSSILGMYYPGFSLQFI